MNKRDWLLALVPLAATAALVGTVGIRMWLTDASGETAPSAVAEAVQPRIVDAPPTLPLNDEIGRSQLIVIGELSEITGAETIPPVGMKDNPPSATEPSHGVQTTRRPARIERYIKGKGNVGDVVTIQELYGSSMPSGRAILFLVPWMADTYQPSVTASLSESKLGLVYADGTPASEPAGTTLDEYGATLASSVARQAVSGAKVALAAAPPSPGDEISLNHLLGTRGLTKIVVRIGAKEIVVSDASKLAQVVDGFEPTVTIERQDAAMQSAPVDLVFQLEGGNSWEFTYDPESGVIAYPAAALQARLPDSARTALSSAVGFR